MASLVDDMLEYRKGRGWLMRNMSELRASYAGRYVAILGSKVIDSDEDMYRLLQRLWSKGLYPGPVIIHPVR